MTEEKKTEQVVEQAVEEAKVQTEDKIEQEAIKKNAEEVTKEIKSMLKEIDANNLAEAVIADNKIEFEHNKEQYRVRRAIYQEKQEANKYRMKRYIELLKDKDCLLEKDLIALYKERNIDINAMDKQVEELLKQQENLMIDLGRAIQENKPKNELEVYKKEIIKLRSQMQVIRAERQSLLEISFENRLMTEVYSYLIWMIAEKKVNGKWERCWKAYEDFMGSPDTALLTKITSNGSLIIAEEFNPSVTE